MFSQRAAVGAFGTRRLEDIAVPNVPWPAGAVLGPEQAAAAAFVTENCLAEFIELEMHFSHRWRRESNWSPGRAWPSSRTYESDQYSHNGTHLK